MPVKFAQMPLSPVLQSPPSRIIGKTNATATESIVACKGFPMALKKLCVVTANQRKIYAVQKILMAPTEISKSFTSSPLTNQEAINSGKKNKSEVDKSPITAVPI